VIQVILPKIGAQFVISARDRTLFIYWGRRGAISELVLELTKVADGESLFSISRQNELFDQISRSGARILPVDTFNRGFGAISNSFRLLSIRREVLAAIEKHRIEQVVVLMSHVWTPLLADSIRRTGVRYVVIVHDAADHPGDATAVVNSWLIRDALRADEVVTLSSYVKSGLVARFPKLADRTSVLFLPILRSVTANRQTNPAAQVGFLFFGRLLAYKGLPLFVEACEILRARNQNFRIAVAGEGNLGAWTDRLAAINAVVINRWLDYDEVASLAAQYDCMVLSNIEASQSGVVALAYGLGMPIIATPVGGLGEQVKDHESGLIAQSISAAAIANAMQVFLQDAELRARLLKGVAQAQAEFSMARFFQSITMREQR
jgi:glycosyltransferase involved in cell wall biosynthesis